MAYPHKVGKGAAERAWPKALSLTNLDQLCAAVRRYVDAKPLDRPWCNPATWLNQRRWEDEPKAVNGHAGKAPVGDVDYSEPWKQRLAGWKPGKFWNRDQWGPPPGDPGCRAPTDLLRSNGP